MSGPVNDELPLGRTVDYPTSYAPDVLRAIPRAGNRAALAIAGPLPFVGEDLWTAWELTWLQQDGRPAIAAAAIVVPAESRCIVESKSLKLYLNSFAMSEFATARDVLKRIEQDLSATVEAPVSVAFVDAAAAAIGNAPGDCIDREVAEFQDLGTARTRLRCNPATAVTEELYSELFRSLCPVTAQPDFASIHVAYRGAQIDRRSLLAYLVAYREHQDFHEACVEQIFVDLQQACAPDALCVSARFLRRGGIDINPWRAAGDIRCAKVRLWRQ